MKQSVLKQKLKKGDQVIGTWCLLPSPSVVNVLAKAGLDFVLIDMEHGPTSFETAQQMILAAEAEGGRRWHLSARDGPSLVNYRHADPCFARVFRRRRARLRGRLSPS